MQPQLNRIYFMDSMRSILMMLGVVLHSSNVFATKQSWLIYSHDTSMIAEYIGQFIHIFRMPAFFLISGFFCALTISRYQPRKFITVRLKRIIIPLITTAVTLNSLQLIILTYTDFRHYTLGKYLLEGGWVSHLWFLNNLIIYYLVATGFVVFLRRPTKIVENYLSYLFLLTPMVIIIAIMPMATIAIFGLNKIGFPLYSGALGVFDTYSILIYLPYFVFGCILGNNNELLYRFSKINPVFTLLAIAGSMFIMNKALVPNEVINQIITVYFQGLVTWLSVALCFFTFYTFFNSASKTWMFLSDASYTVYLFHHVFVVAIGIVLIQVGFSPLLSMLILIAITAIITLYIHKHFILQSTYARLLFNGK